MTEQTPILAEGARDSRVDDIIKLAILAVGGQGGGVLTNWIEDLARAEDYAAQATSVAGVAQRTGATIYYVEMVRAQPDRVPVFSLAPAGGDVDILIAAELMEAGRAIMRGFVTPDRTTLIASTHRALAVSEKSVPGDGIAKVEEVRAAAEIAAKRLILHDMEALAVSTGSVISASLFGALAGAEVLPFPRAAFENAIRRSGKAVEASLRAFEAGFAAAQTGSTEVEADPEPEPLDRAPRGPDALTARWQMLASRVDLLPCSARDMARAGLQKVVDFQDLDYGAEYLDRLDRVVKLDNSDKNWLFTRETAKYLANAMAYDDVIRVADLKTRGRRFRRIGRDMGQREDQVMMLTEFMHPRADEIAGMLPARMSARIEASPAWMARLDRWFNKGRRVRTDTLRGYGMLYLLGGLRGYRRRTRRHEIEAAHREAWLAQATGILPEDYDLAVEIMRCRRLIKGYSDTHARGLSKFDRVTAMAPRLLGRDDAASWLERLREAALKDENGKALDGAIRTVESFL